jgi:hypothetical protein
MVFGKCTNCGKISEKHAKGFCITCYKKIHWKPKSQICKKCNRELPLHAKGLCGGCYSTVFHLQYNKDQNYKKYHKIEPEVYKRITKSCLICGFDKVVDLHHLDKNRQNNSEDNLIGLCPNHHRMKHDLRYSQEIMNLIKEKLTK